jgi:hypothetical protein
VAVTSSDRLASGLELGAYEESGFAGAQRLDEDLEQFLMTPGIAGSPLAAELAAAKAVDSSSKNMLPDVGAWARRIRDALAGRRHSVVSTEKKAVPVRAYYAWIPPVPGAKGSFSLSASAGREGGMSVEFAGIGGGPDFSLSVNDKTSFPDLKSSMRIDLKVLMTFETIEISKGGVVESYYPRLVAVDEAASWEPRVPTLLELPGINSPKWGPALNTTELSNTDIGAERAIEIEQGIKWSGSFGLELDAIGLDFGVEYAAETVETAVIEVSLPPGHDYKPVLYEGHPGVVWYISQSGAA